MVNYSLRQSTKTTNWVAQGTHQGALPWPFTKQNWLQGNYKQLCRTNDWKVIAIHITEHIKTRNGHSQPVMLDETINIPYTPTSQSVTDDHHATNNGDPRRLYTHGVTLSCPSLLHLAARPLTSLHELTHAHWTPYFRSTFLWVKTHVHGNGNSTKEFC